MSSSFYGSTLHPVSPGNTIDPVIRTKILLLGMRRYVRPPSLPNSYTVVCSPTDVQEWQDVDPGSPVQQPPAKTDVLPGDDAPCDQAYVRVRRLPPSPARRALKWPRTSTVIPLEIWDCPGTVALDTLEAPLSAFASTVFVIDIQVSFGSKGACGDFGG